MDMLTGYIVAAMMSWVPVKNHALYETAEETTARYVDIATTITEVAMDPNNDPLYAGEYGRLKTALLLASVASSESHFRKEVDTCKISGDKGKAWGIFQTHSSKESVCGSRTDAANIALRMMRYSVSHCRRFPLLDRMSGYTDGTCHGNWKRSRLKMTRAHNWFDKSLGGKRVVAQHENESNE